MPTDDDDRLLSTSDVGRRLGVGRERGRQIVNRDDFPDAKQQVGRTRLWRSSDVEKWVAENRPERADG